MCFINEYWHQVKVIELIQNSVHHQRGVGAMLHNSKLITLRAVVICLWLLGSTVLIDELFAVENRAQKAQNFSATKDYSSEIEKQIAAGITSTADLIVNYHPRFWIRGNWDWDAFNEEGSFAWRFVHGFTMENGAPANDQMKHEVLDLVKKADSDYPIYGEYDYATQARRFLWVIAAAEVAKRGDSDYKISEKLINGKYVAGSSSPKWPLIHTEDKLLSDARIKLLKWHAEALEYPDECHSQFLIHASAGYDWLVDRKYSDGITPVLSNTDRQQIQSGLISIAEHYRERALNNDRRFFDAGDICWFTYVAVGLALYEPDGQGISPEYNARAKQYLDDIDEYWIDKILPAMNEQGGTGGWHGGLCKLGGEWWNHDDHEDVLTYRIAPLLFAHYTATGQDYKNSLMNSGFEKYAIEFQNYMIYPDGDYVVIGPQTPQRYKWIGPYFSYTRRRFSLDPENQRQGEIGGWIGIYRVPGAYRNASYDQFDQAMFEEKWPDPRTPEELGCGTRHFAKLGWVAMRSGFFSPDDLAALFICQRYHWSNLDPYAQNSFSLERKGKLIEGYHNTIWLDDQYQRTITAFPTLADGVAAYSPGSTFDVGPGIQTFESTDQYDCILGDATNAYTSNKLEKFTRGLVWLKANNVFVMFDRVVTKATEIKKSWIIDPGAIPQKEGDRLFKITNGAGALWIKRFLPEQASEVISQNKFEVVPSQPALEDYFLYVMQAVDASYSKDSPEMVADDAELITYKNKIGIRIDSWEILFATNGEATIWVNGVAVPVELCLFEATIKKGIVQLKWQTASEINNYGFEIERSLNKNNYQKIGFIRGNGTINSLQFYEFLDETVTEGTYYYRLKQLNFDGSFKYSRSVSVTLSLPDKFILQQNYPNPFSVQAEINYSLSVQTHVNLTIYNILGQKIKNLVDEVQQAGTKNLKWDGTDGNGINVSSGIYICILETEYCVLSRKLLFLSKK